MNLIRRLPPVAELIRLLVELRRVRGFATVDSVGANGLRLPSVKAKFESGLEGCIEPSRAMGPGLVARTLHHRSQG